MPIHQDRSPEHRDPYPRRILLCVTGLSPQIVTETIYALAVAQPSPWIPTEVQLLTTQRGAENARLMLLSKQPGWFGRLCRDWSLPPIAFDSSHIYTIDGADGLPLRDIRDDIDNQRAADCIADRVRTLSHDDNSEIHASIAGGRKTMGFFLGYAMSLWGREQDRLSHVLVSAPYEARPEFFYPTPSPHVIAANERGQDPLDAREARVWLGDIPFVRLRHLLPDSLRTGAGRFAEAVAAANTALDQIALEVDVSQSSIRINGVQLKLPPMQFAFLSLLAWREMKGLPATMAPNKDANDTEWKQLALRDLKTALGDLNIPGRVYDRLTSPSPLGDTFNEQLSKLKRAMRASGLLPWRELITGEQGQAAGRQRVYRLALSPKQIRFVQGHPISKLATQVTD